MSLQDRTQPALARCACGHEVVVHELIVSRGTTKAVRRGECSYQDAKGKCQCKGPR